MTGLCLVPEPNDLVRTDGTHEISSPAVVQVSRQATDGERIAAESVGAALWRRGIGGEIRGEDAHHDARGAIILAVAGRDQDMVSSPDSRPLPIDSPAPHEAYSLSIEPDRIVVVGASPVGLAQGTRTLVQLLETVEVLPCLTITDAPAMRLRGVMLDISRGRVPTLATLKTIVDVISSFKLNMLQLYMENTFAFRSHPRIGEGWGAMTPEEVMELDAYCRDRFVELIPCFQSLGHQRRLLSLPEYRHLAYSPEDWTLAPGEKTWQLLGELYDDLLPCFSSRYVNVCCDEPYDLTLTSARSHEVAIGYAHGSESVPAKSAGPMQLYLTHVQRLHDMLARRGRTMMVWDDIFQQAPDLLAEMPRDVVYLCWFYEATAAYPQPFEIRQAGAQSVVCPGTSSWSTLFARLDNARGNIRGFVRAGIEAGSLGALTTDWGDNGHPNMLVASWYGYVYGGAESWSPGRLSDAEFDQRFARLFFGAVEGEAALEAMWLMSAACTLPGINKMNGSATRAMFFRDPIRDDMASLAPDESIERMEELGVWALDLLVPLRGVDADRALTLGEMRLAARQIVHAARKTRAGRRLAARSAEGREDRRGLHADLTALKRELHELRWEYQRLWLARNKPEGLWLSLDNFDVAAEVLDRWRDEVAPTYRFGQ